MSIVLSSPKLLIPRVHAATGDVCLADPSAVNLATPCPASPPLLSGPVGQEIRVGVFVQGSDALNGFDITLIADHTLLTPLSVDLTRTVVPGATTIIVECVQGILKAGSVCASTDNIDTLHLVITAGLGLITSPPTTGLLFTAVYNITGTTSSGGIPLGFQTGCGSSTSVSGGVCITIANGSTTPDVETSQASTFDNSAASTMAFVQLSASPTSFGPEFPGTSNSATVTATAMNGYPGFGPPDMVNFTSASTTGVTVTLGANSCVTGGVSCTVSVTLSATASGNYTTTISGTYETSDASSNLDTLVSVVVLTVTVYDFGLLVSPTSITFISGSTGVATVSLSSLNHFAGSVTLSSGTIVPAGLTITYSPSTVTLVSGQTINSTATFSASPSSNTLYHAIIKATSATRIKNSPTLSVTANLGHLTTTSLSCTPISVNVNSPTTCTATVTDTNASPTTPSGTVGFTSDSAGTFTPAKNCNLSPGTTGTASCQVTYTPNSFGTGTHNVTGTYSGDSTHGRSIGKFLLTVTIPGATSTTTVSCSPSSVTVNQASTCIATVTSSDSNTPMGSVSFASDGNGLIVTSPCTLSGVGSTATCSVSYTPSAIGTGTHKITASYPGDSGHGGSNGNFNLTVTDFGLTAVPTAVNVNVGSAGGSSIIVSPMNGFTGDVALTSDNTSCSLTPTTVTGGSGSSTLSCTFSATGSVTVTVTGTIGSLSHTAPVTFSVRDFTISASPTTVTVGTNTLGNSTITAAPVNGFSSTLTLGVSTNSTNLSCTVTPTSIAGASGMSTLSCSSSVAGNYQANVTGTSSSLVHFTLVTYHITAPVPDFTVNANPTSLTLNATVTGASTITIGFVNGFSGTVTLSVSTNSTSLVCNLSSSTVTSPGSVTVSCSANVAGNFLANVTGVSGSLSHSSIVVAHIHDFGVAANPASVSTAPSVAVDSTITITSLNGFTNTVSLSVATNSTNLSCNLSTTSISGGSGTSTLSCTGSIGNYSVNVTGTSGPLSKITTLLVEVTDFTVSANPTIVTGLATVSASSTITVAPTGSFSGTVSLVVLVSPSALSCSFNPATLVLGPSQTSTLSCSGPAGSYTATVTGMSGSISHTATITFDITDFTLTASPTSASVIVDSSASSTVTISPVNGFNMKVDLIVVANSTNLSCSLSSTSITGGSGTSTLSCQGSVSANYLATVIGTNGTLSRSVGVTFAIGDFELSLSNATPAVPEGTSGTVTVTVTSLNGFSGTVNLVLSNKTSVPTGYPRPVYTLSPTSVTLTANGSVTATLTIDISARVYPSTYQIFVNGTVGSRVVPAPLIILTVPRPDFSIGHSPVGSVNIVPGQTGTANISLNATDGFNGSVTFSYTVNPSGLTCSFSRSSVVLLPAGTNTTTISCSGSTQVYTVTVTGTALETYDQGITHVTIPVFSVVDFAIHPTPSGITLNVGQTGHAQINVTWTIGYAGIVVFKAFPSNSAVTATIQPNLTGSGTVTLNVTSTMSGTFTVVLNATSNTVTHSTTITLTVLSSSSGTILGLDPTLFYSIVGILVVLVGVAAVLGLRRGKAPSRKN